MPLQYISLCATRVQQRSLSSDSAVGHPGVEDVAANGNDTIVGVEPSHRELEVPFAAHQRADESDRVKAARPGILHGLMIFITNSELGLLGAIVAGNVKRAAYAKTNPCKPVLDAN